MEENGQEHCARKEVFLVYRKKEIKKHKALT